MSTLFYLSRAQLDRIKPYFPLSHGIPRVDDLRILSGIIYVIKHGLQWKDAPREYGPHKTLYNRVIRWSRLGVFNKIFMELVEKQGNTERLMIDATHLKAHRTAASLLKKGLFPAVSGGQKADWTPNFTPFVMVKAGRFSFSYLRAKWVTTKGQHSFWTLCPTPGNCSLTEGMMLVPNGFTWKRHYALYTFQENSKDTCLVW